MEITYLLLILIMFCIHLSCCRAGDIKTSCPMRERRALLEFKLSVDPSGAVLSSWVGGNCCKWVGVGCSNTTGNVVKLNLRSTTDYETPTTDYETPFIIIATEVSPSLTELKHLEYLDLSNNDFNGIRIPNFFGDLRALRYLNLSFANFAGLIPHSFGNLTSLHTLDLSLLQDLKADNLDWLSGLSSLKIIDMSGLNLGQVSNLSQIFGSFPSISELSLANCQLSNLPLSPSSYPNLTALSVLKLGQNNIQSRQFPYVIQNLTNLVTLDLSANLFAGPLPEWLSQLKNLQHLILATNHLHGSIPTSLSMLLDLVEIDLDSTNLTGSIPERLGTMPLLREVRLGHNQLTGSIPTSLGTSSSLTTLILTSNQLNGSIPIRLGASSSLTEIDLSENQLSGVIPTALGTSSSVTSINLGSNQLSGPIPAFGSTSSPLTTLNLESNQLNGSIPTSLGQLSSLETLSLSKNTFTGVVSEVHFEKLSKLTMLDMSSNSLAFNVNSDWVPPFQLGDLNLGSCTLGPKFPLWLQTQSMVQYVKLPKANISYPVPNWFWNLIIDQINSLDLSYNQIPGSIPPINRTSPSPISLYLGSNHFEGPLPPFPQNIDVLDLSNNRFSGSIRENINTMSPKLKVLLLSNNSLSGSIPSSLCKMPSLQILDLSNNDLVGGLPKNCWSASNNIRIIDISSNKLSGAIPTSIGNLSLVNSLRLNNNLFSGELPVTIEKCQNLTFLDLSVNGFSGNLPSWIGKLSSLQILKLRSNKFGGGLIHELCQLYSLRILDLAQNNFSGTIPPCFKNFSGMISGVNMNIFNRFRYDGKLKQTVKGREMEYTKVLKFWVILDLSSNLLVGNIPAELTFLLKLNSLDVSSNQLTGGIPKKIGNLRSLQSLDFSRNRLSGTIPDSISELGSIGYLNLSDNSLEGQIPFGHLQTFNASCFMGNPNLCGIPLDTNCTQDSPTPAIDVVQNKETTVLKTDGFYIGIGVGSVVGFWGVCGFLFFKKTWWSTLSGWFGRGHA